MKPDIDLHKIEENLRTEFTPSPTKEKPNPKCPFKFSIRRHTGHRILVAETDDRTDIHINQKRIRTPVQLDQTINDCRHAITWGNY